MRYQHASLLLILWIALAMPADVTGQNAATHSITLNIGPSHLQRQDLVFSPFIHTALSGLNGGLQLETNKKWLTRYRIQYAGFSAGLETPYNYIYEGDVKTAQPHSFTFITLGYAAGAYLGKKEINQPVLGGSLQADVQAMNYQYGRYSFFGYYSTTAASVWYQHTLPIGKKSVLSGQVQLPIVSWLARSPYLVNDDEFIENTYSHNGITTLVDLIADGDVATWDKLQRLDFDVHYCLNPSATWQFGIRYGMTFIHSTVPRQLTWIQQDLHLSITRSL
jgi:hypothetical protein